MKKLQIIMNDKNHKFRTKPEGKKFDNNYLYYLYCKGESEGNYDDARLYLHKHIGQLVDIARPKSIAIPYELHDDVETEMYMVVDEMYRGIFEDDRIVGIVDRDGNESTGSRFYKYYQPAQVYGYIKSVVRFRIIDYFNRIRSTNDNEFSLIKADKPVFDYEDIHNRVGYEIILNKLLSSITSLSTIDTAVLALVGLQQKSFRQASDAIGITPYKVKESYNRTIDILKEKAIGFNIKDFE